MSPRAAFIAIGAGLLTAAASAQTPPDLHKRLTGVTQIDIKPGINRIRNAEGDGRDAQVISADRQNGNAWGFGVYMVVMRPRWEEAKSDWAIVGIAEKDHNLSTQITDRPHTGEDDLKVVRFAHGTLDGKPKTLLIIAERTPAGSVPDPAPAKIRIFALRAVTDEETIGSTPDVFEPVIEYQTTKLYSDADDALLDELKLPLPSF
jgi:hypothetical protein